MNRKQLKEAKNFRNQLIVSSIVLWIASLSIQYYVPDAINDSTMIGIAATIITVLAVNMHIKIKDFRNYKY